MDRSRTEPNIAPTYLPPRFSKKVTAKKPRKLIASSQDSIQKQLTLPRKSTNSRRTPAMTGHRSVSESHAAAPPGKYLPNRCRVFGLKSAARPPATDLARAFRRVDAGRPRGVRRPISRAGVATDERIATAHNPNGARQRDGRDFGPKSDHRSRAGSPAGSRAVCEIATERLSATSQILAELAIERERPTSLDAGLSYNRTVAGFRYRSFKL